MGASTTHKNSSRIGNTCQPDLRPPRRIVHLPRVPTNPSSIRGSPRHPRDSSRYHSRRASTLDLKPHFLANRPTISPHYPTSHTRDPNHHISLSLTTRRRRLHTSTVKPIVSTPHQRRMGTGSRYQDGIPISPLSIHRKILSPAHVPTT